MGKLFLPAETRGLWDSKSRSLTVYQGEDAYVGYEGTVAELPAVQFSAFGPNLGECANEVINEGGARRSTRIDTKLPGTLQFTVTDGNDKPLAAPATIYIRVRPNYRQAKPEGQMDEAACWAACLSWWLRNAPGRPNISQGQLVVLGTGLWSQADGQIRPAALEQFVVKQGYRMRTHRVQPRNLRDHLGKWPLLLGFTASGGFGHMNVLCGQDKTFDTVDGMESMYPDPIYDDGYTAAQGNFGTVQFNSKVDGSPFVYTGAVRTGLSYSSYATSPLNAGFFWVGYPQEYDARP